MQAQQRNAQAPPLKLNEQLLHGARQQKISLFDSLSNLAPIKNTLTAILAGIDQLTTMPDDAFARHLRSSFSSSQNLIPDHVARDIRLQTIESLEQKLRDTAAHLSPHLATVTHLMTLSPDESGQHNARTVSALHRITQLTTSSHEVLNNARQLVADLSELGQFLTESKQLLSKNTLQSLACEYLEANRLCEYPHIESNSLKPQSVAAARATDPLSFEYALRAIDLYEHLVNPEINGMQPTLHIAAQEAPSLSEKPDLLVQRLASVALIDRAQLTETLRSLVRDSSLAQEIADTAFMQSARYQAQAVVVQHKLALSYAQFVQLNQSFSVDQLSAFAETPRTLILPATLVRDTLLQSTASGCFDPAKLSQLLDRFSKCLKNLSPLERIALSISATETPRWLASEQALDAFERHRVALSSDANLQAKLKLYAAFKVITRLLEQGPGKLFTVSEAAMLLVYVLGTPEHNLMVRNNECDSGHYRRMFRRDQKRLLPSGATPVSIDPSRLNDALAELTLFKYLVKDRSRRTEGSLNYQLAPHAHDIPHWKEITTIIKALRTQSPHVEQLLSSRDNENSATTQTQSKIKVPKIKLQSPKERDKGTAKCLAAFDSLSPLIDQLALSDDHGSYAANAQRIASAIGQLHKVVSAITPAATSHLSLEDAVSAIGLLKPPRVFDPIAICDYTSQCQMVLAAWRNNLLHQSTPREKQ